MVAPDLPSQSRAPTLAWTTTDNVLEAMATAKVATATVMVTIHL
jgi:hypothetical protein